MMSVVKLKILQAPCSFVVIKDRTVRIVYLLGGDLFLSAQEVKSVFSVYNREQLSTRTAHCFFPTAGLNIISVIFCRYKTGDNGKPR